MANTVVIPKVFQKRRQLAQRPYRLLDFDGLSCVHYHHLDDRSERLVVVTTYLFVVVLNGTKIMHTEAGDIRLAAGEAFFARKDSYLYSEFISNDRPFESLIFFINDTFLSEFLRAYSHLVKEPSAARAPAGIFKIVPTPLFQAALQSILPYFLQETDYTAAFLKLKFAETLLHIAEADRQGNFLAFLQSIHAERKKDLALLMAENVCKPLKVEEYARLSGRSLSAFKKEFNRVFELSPKKWINQKRLSRAYVLLKASGDNVSQVCFDVGFENLSYFTQLFKKNYGLTPKQLQKDRNQQK